MPGTGHIVGFSHLVVDWCKTRSLLNQSLSW